MKKITFAVIMFLTVLLCSSAATTSQLAAAVGPITAAEATARFFAALLAGDIDTAIAMTLAVKGVPANTVREEYQELATFIKKNGSPEVVSHLQLGETAVVVVREGGLGKKRTVDLDPAFLVRRDQKWLVVFKLTRFDRPYHEFDEATLASLKQIQEWFESQKRDLQALLRKNSAD